MTMTSRTGTEADSGDWSPVVSKCHQRLIILYVVYHGSTISQADCNHLLLRRLTTTTTTIQLPQNRNVVSVLTSWSGDPLRPRPMSRPGWIGKCLGLGLEGLGLRQLVPVHTPATH